MEGGAGALSQVIHGVNAVPVVQERPQIDDFKAANLRARC
jgi:hypothetical protein